MNKFYKTSDSVYTERSILLSLISKSHKSYLALHDPGWDIDFFNIVVIEIRGKACSWQIQEHDLIFFKHLKVNPNYKWDKDSNREKYCHIPELEGPDFIDKTIEFTDIE
jgi:hypothetical protein